jgi:hypothetical protein
MQRKNFLMFFLAISSVSLFLINCTFVQSQSSDPSNTPLPTNETVTASPTLIALSGTDPNQLMILGFSVITILIVIAGIVGAMAYRGRRYRR